VLLVLLEPVASPSVVNVWIGEGVRTSLHPDVVRSLARLGSSSLKFVVWEYFAISVLLMYGASVVLP
jgi:hypothetical protein